MEAENKERRANPTDKIMTDTEIMHVVFAADTGYYQHLCVTLVSILENNRDLRVHAHVLTNRLSDENEKPLRFLEKQYDNLVLDFQEVDHSQFDNLKLTIDYISVQTYYRYLVARLFPELDKVLYLDCDIVVRGDLRELWRENLDGYYAAGVADSFVIKNRASHLDRIGFQGRNDYVNAGVMLFNLKAIREDKLIGKFFSCQQTNQNILEFQDQDVINMVLKGGIKLVSPVFNCVGGKLRWFSKNTLASPVIVHYVGKCKPWILNAKCSHPFKKDYYFYLRKTSYAGLARCYRFMQSWLTVREFLFSMKTNGTAFRIKIFGIRVYKKQLIKND